MYMDRNYVQTKTLLSAYDLGISIYKTIVILNPEINAKITNWVLENIKKDRAFQIMTIEKCLIRSVLSMLGEVSNRDKNIYISTFESPFIEESKIFFTQEAQD